jgi:hydroxymethylbilane synthase
MQTKIRIGTRDSQLAVWQATQVQALLAAEGVASELVFVKSEGDLDLITPLYEMGVQGIFTRSLDIALLNRRIDMAVHSMKDVPVRLPAGIAQAAVLKRGRPGDLLVYKDVEEPFRVKQEGSIIASSSLRRKAQWLNRYPGDIIEPLRGNVNTRLKKLKESRWYGAIFAVAGLERIGVRPPNAVELDWMIPAPAQGAIMINCREDDDGALASGALINDPETALCTKIERDFLALLMGGCSTPIGALAVVREDRIFFKGNLLTPDGLCRLAVEREADPGRASMLARDCAGEILAGGGQEIIQGLHHA